MTFQSASLTNQGYSLLERQIVAARMKPRASFALLMLVLLAGSCPSADAATLRVGRQRTYKTPCAAIAAAVPGDVIEIDAALYRGDVCAWSTNNLTLRGVNGRAHLAAAGKNSQGKGIWVSSGNDTLIENVEFSGAVVPDENGAGIRYSGVNLTVRNCYFHDNQEGILEGNVAGSSILIENSEFENNGFHDGQSHNLYIGHAATLTFRFNYSHRAIAGHLLKSRAAVNYILYNRLTEENGTGSYEINVPNGGTTYVIGNLIQQGTRSQNSTLLSYLEEGIAPQNPGHDLYVVNNTFVNRATSGTFVFMGASGNLAASIQNNIFSGPGVVTNQTSAVLTTNFSGVPGFADKQHYDYHLTAGSPAIDAGTDPGLANGFSRKPQFEYAHPAGSEERLPLGKTIDIGAYEYRGAAQRARPIIQPTGLRAHSVAHEVSAEREVRFSAPICGPPFVPGEAIQ